MKINFAVALCDLDGQPHKKADKEDLTLKDATIQAMMAILEQDSDENGESKFQRFMIAQKVHTGSEVELTPEEVASIKKRIGLAFGAAVVGPAFTILNG